MSIAWKIYEHRLEEKFICIQLAGVHLSVKVSNHYWQLPKAIYHLTSDKGDHKLRLGRKSPQR